MKRNQNGFTLIELIMVIVILGILSAVAIPKFADLKTSSTIAALEGLYGSIQSATNIIHSYAITEGMQSTAYVGTAATIASQSVEIDGVPIGIQYLYPTSRNSFNRSVDYALESDIGDAWVIQYASQDVIRFRPQGYITSDACRVVYEQATATSAPVITIETTDC